MNGWLSMVGSVLVLSLDIYRDGWLIDNSCRFYNQINLLYGSITEFCSPQSCPEMKATDE